MLDFGQTAVSTQTKAYDGAGYSELAKPVPARRPPVSCAQG